MVRLDRTISQNTMYIMLEPMVRSSRTMTKEATESHSLRRLVLFQIGLRFILRPPLLGSQIARHLRPSHQLVDLHRVIQRVIRLKRQLRRVSQRQRMRHLTAQPGCRTFQRWQQRFHIRTPEPRNKSRRMFQIRTEPHFAHGDIRRRQFRIAKLPPCENTSQNMANFFGHAQLPLCRRSGSRPLRPSRERGVRTRLVSLWAQPGTISVSKHSTTSPSCRSWKFANDNPHS